MLNKSIGTMLLAASVLLSACATREPPLSVWPKEQRAQAHIELGRSYLKRGDLDFARERFRKAIEVFPESSTAYHGLGLVEAQALRLNQARDYLERAVHFDETNIDARSDYAVILCETGDAKRGIRLLEQTKVAPEARAVGLNLALGRCYQADNKRNEAERAFQSVLLINPAIRQALLSMANLKFSEQEFLSSRAFLQRYFSTNTVSSEALLLAAKVEDKLENFAARDDYTRQLWARYPKSKQASAARGLFIQ